MRSLMIVALFGTVAVGGSADAQTAPSAPAAAKPLKGDADRDGKVSRAEFVRRAEARFAKLDADENGSLTREEVRVGHRRRAGAHGGVGGPFEAVRADVAQDGAAPPPPGSGMRGRDRRGGGMVRQDTDGDGRVSRAEFDAQSARTFARIDANGDGTVDAAEMASAPGRGRMGRAGPDGGGTMTRAEFDARAGRHFARMDGNGDGVIDAAELRSGPMGRGDRGGRRAAPAPVPTPVVPPTGA